MCLHIRWEGEESTEALPAGIKKKKRVTHIKKKKNWDMNKWQEDRDEGSRCSGEVHETWFEGKCRKLMKEQWAERKGLEAAGRLEEKEREGMASRGDRRGGEHHGGGDGGDSW